MNPNCTIYQTMDYLSKKWAILILLELFKGEKNKKRYSEIKKNMKDVTPKILSARLKELEKNKMITKEIDTTTIPIKSIYSLTPSGEDFIRIIKDIKKWALKWNIDNDDCDNSDCKNCIFEDTIKNIKK